MNIADLDLSTSPRTPYRRTMTSTNFDHVLLSAEHTQWIPTGPGKSFRPVHFDDHGWTELMRVEPGALVARHHHTGEVHGFNLSGQRELIEAGLVVGPGDYVYEPQGNIDSWRGVGDEPCIIHIRVVGEVEFFDEHGELVSVASSASQQAIYLEWCRDNDVTPEPSLALALDTVAEVSFQVCPTPDPTPSSRAPMS